MAAPQQPTLHPSMIGPAEFPSSSYFHGIIYQPGCSVCPLQLQRKVAPDGPIPARLVYVGEEPGDREVEFGRGFIGPSGKLLWYLAKLAGVTRDQVWVTNASLCQSPKRGIWLPSGAWISKVRAQAMAAQCCRQRLIAEILYVTQGALHPVVQPLGNWALWALTDIPSARIYDYRGSRVDMDLPALYKAIVEGRARTPSRQLQLKDAV